MSLEKSEILKIFLLIILVLAVVFGVMYIHSAIVQPALQASANRTQIATTQTAQSDFFNNILPCLEDIYYAFSLILLFVGLYGVQQIWLLKKDIRIRNRRASAEMAAEYASRFANYALQRRKFVRECEERKLPLYDEKIEGFAIESLKNKWLATVEQKMEMDSCIATINELELIAMAFVCGIADEAIGFEAIGRGFCSTVTTHYDIFTVRGSENFFINVRKLYNTWSTRINAHELDKQRAILEKRAMFEKSRRDESTTYFPPIGSEGND